MCYTSDGGESLRYAVMEYGVDPSATKLEIERVPKADSITQCKDLVAPLMAKIREECREKKAPIAPTRTTPKRTSKQNTIDNAATVTLKLFILFDICTEPPIRKSM
jgi:hypothetical protein